MSIVVHESTQVSEGLTALSRKLAAMVSNDSGGVGTKLLRFERDPGGIPQH